MSPYDGPVRVLQSFPHKIGAARICTTAWHQAAGAAEAGADVLVMAGAVQRPLPAAVRVRPTLARGRLRIPYKALGRTRALALHDRLVAASPRSWNAPTRTPASPTRPCGRSASASA